MQHWPRLSVRACPGHELLSRHSTFHVGGPADLFLTTHTAEELETAVRLAGAGGIPIRVLGSGANILPSDAGVRGLVIRNVSRRFLLEEDGNRVTVESGMVLPVLARRTAKAGLAGRDLGGWRGRNYSRTGGP